MRIKKGFDLRDVCGESVIVAHGKENIDFSKVVSLNETATFLWKQVEGRDFTEDEMVKVLTEDYEVSEETARTDVHNLVTRWAEIGLLE